MKYRPFRAQHLVQWNVRMCQDNTEPLVDKVVEAVCHQQGIQFEHTSEYRNIYSYDKLWEALEHYDREYVVSSRNSYFKRGLDRAYRVFSCPDAKQKLKPVDLMRTVAELFVDLGIKGDRSAGLTAYGESKMEAFTIGLDKSIAILTEQKSPAPCLAGIRTQRKGKTRLVWMYPLEMTIIEAILARPIINYFKGADSVMTFGDYSHEVGMHMRRSIAETKYHYAFDQSQFDAHVTPQAISYAFAALATWFDLDDKVYANVTVREILRVVEKYFVCTPIVMPNRKGKYPLLVTGKRGGVPSGSYFTQLVDSFVNAAIMFAASEKFKLGLKDDNLYVLGDDSCMFCNNDSGELLKQKVVSFCETIGFKVNLTKSVCGPNTEEVEYLGRTWRNGFPIRTMYEMMRGALYPENYRRYSKDRALRQKEALSTVHSYLLTSYIEDPSVGIEAFNSVYHVSPWMSSGLTAYLLKCGLIPGDVLSRAVY